MCNLYNFNGILLIKSDSQHIVTYFKFIKKNQKKKMSTTKNYKVQVQVTKTSQQRFNKNDNNL